MTKQDLQQGSQERPVARRSSLPCLVVAVVILLLLYGFARLRESGNSGGSHPAVGAKLQGLELQALLHSSGQVSLQDLTGRATLINYWGPWCGPCRREMPHLIELERELSGRDDFRLISVSCGIQQAYSDLGELRDATDQFARDNLISFPVYYDPGGHSRGVLVASADLEGFGYPTSLLVDQDLVIRGVWVGYNLGMEDDVERVVRRLLN
jgi:thiol-disulfide isomerase/thioredoxin